MERIKDIVAMQQTQAQTTGAIETLALPDPIEDALRDDTGGKTKP